MKSPAGSTARLLFEPLGPEHATELAKPLLDPAVYEYIIDVAPETVADLQRNFAMRAAGPRPESDIRYWWDMVIRLRDSGEAIGRLEATIVDDRAEIAYLLGPKHWGHGYASEAVAWLHEQLRPTDITTLWATAVPGNNRSIHLLEKLGYQQVEANWPRLLSYDAGDRVFRRDL